MATQGTRRQSPPRPRPSLADTRIPRRPPPPRPRLRKEIPIDFSGTPSQPAPSRGDTRTLLPAPPPRPRLRRSSSAPFRGAGSVPGRISGEQPCPGCSRWAAVPGSSPGYPHVLDRGDIATGGGADGEGACPLPCLPRSNHLTPRHPHPDRACGAPPPPPSGGRGPCPGVYQGSSRARAYIRGAAVSGV